MGFCSFCMTVLLLGWPLVTRSCNWGHERESNMSQTTAASRHGRLYMACKRRCRKGGTVELLNNTICCFTDLAWGLDGFQACQPHSSKGRQALCRRCPSQTSMPAKCIFDNATDIESKFSISTCCQQIAESCLSLPQADALLMYTAGARIF